VPLTVAIARARLTIKFRYRGTVIASGLVVAMKKLKNKMSPHGADPSALREIRVLKEIAHANVVQLHDAFFHKT